MMWLSTVLMHVVLSVATAPAAGEAVAVGAAADRSELAALPPQVRLRKLHLVRPDLIPYPLFSEIYC